MDTKVAVKSFGALAQETRIQTLRLLIQEGKQGMASGNIAEVIGVPQNTMSSHLSILVNAGLLESRREGRSVIYRVDFESMKDLIGFLLEDCCQGNPRECGSLLDTILPGDSPPVHIGHSI